MGDCAVHSWCTVITQGESQFPARAVPCLSACSLLICVASIHVSSYIFKDIQVLLGLDEFLKFLKKDSWMLLCVLIFHFNVLLAILLYCFQITYKSSTGQRWWSTYGQCPIRQSPSHGSRSNWPMGTHFRPSCWSVGFSHTHKHPHNNCSFSIIVHFFQMFYVFFLQFL